MGGMPQIRAFSPADADALYEVCLLTGADGDDATAQYSVPTLLGEVYVGPYLALEPEWAWVVEHEGGVAGYILGTPDTTAFEERCEREWWPALRERLPLGTFAAGSPDADVAGLIHEPLRAPPAVVRDYPAHLHIDLLPHVQGHGLGGSLMGTLFEALRARKVPGIHWGVSPTNVRAVGFYEHLGFEVLHRDPHVILMGSRL